MEDYSHGRGTFVLLSWMRSARIYRYLYNFWLAGSLDGWEVFNEYNSIIVLWKILLHVNNGVSHRYYLITYYILLKRIVTKKTDHYFRSYSIAIM